MSVSLLKITSYTLNCTPSSTPVCHPPSPAFHRGPCPGPRPRSTPETHSEPLQRADLQAQAAGHRGDVESRRWGSGGALPQTPEQKYRLIYLSAGASASLRTSVP